MKIKIITVILLAYSCTVYGQSFNHNEYNSMAKAIKNYLQYEDKILTEYKANLSNDTTDYYEIQKQEKKIDVRMPYDDRLEMLSGALHVSTSSQLSKNENLLNLLIYIVENEPLTVLVKEAILGMGHMAFYGNTEAQNYLYNTWQDQSIPFIIRLHYINSILLLNNNTIALNYLLDIIIKSQKVSTLNYYYYSHKEKVISQLLIYNIILLNEQKRNYLYLQPIMRQLLFSRCKSVQAVIATHYYEKFGYEESKKFIDYCQEIIESPNTEHNILINAIFGLQAFSDRKFKSSGLGSSGYFNSLIGRSLYDNHGNKYESVQYIDTSESEKRLSMEEKIFFHERYFDNYNTNHLFNEETFWIRD